MYLLRVVISHIEPSNPGAHLQAPVSSLQTLPFWQETVLHLSLLQEDKNTVENTETAPKADNNISLTLFFI
jgi:hypothetical protein